MKTHFKKTKIYVRAYCSDFHYIARKDHYLSVAEAEELIQKVIINTAMIRGVEHLLEEGNLYINNDKFVDCFIIKIRKNTK